MPTNQSNKQNKKFLKEGSIEEINIKIYIFPCKGTRFWGIWGPLEQQPEVIKIYFLTIYPFLDEYNYN